VSRAKLAGRFLYGRAARSGAWLSKRSGSYLHGTTPERQGALSALNDLLNRAAMRELACAAGSGSWTSARASVSSRATWLAPPGTPWSGSSARQQQIAEARRQAKEAGEEALLQLRQATPRKGCRAARKDRTPRPCALRARARPGSAHRRAHDDASAQVRGPHRLRTTTTTSSGSGPSRSASALSGARTCAAFDRLGKRPVRGTQAHRADPRRRRPADPFGLLFFGACAGEKTFVQLVDNMLRWSREPARRSSGTPASGVDVRCRARRAAAVPGEIGRRLLVCRVLGRGREALKERVWAPPAKSSGPRSRHSCATCTARWRRSGALRQSAFATTSGIELQPLYRAARLPIPGAAGVPRGSILHARRAGSGSGYGLHTSLGRRTGGTGALRRQKRRGYMAGFCTPA